MIFLLANKHKHNKLRQVKTHIGISIDIEYIGFAYACTYGWCLNICRRRFTGHKRCYAVWMKTRLTKNLCSSGVPQSMSKKKWKRIPNCNINYRSSLHVMFPYLVTFYRIWSPCTYLSDQRFVNLSFALACLQRISVRRIKTNYITKSHLLLFIN